MATIIVSLGGSLIVPKDIDTKFLKGFKKVIADFIKKGNKAVIYCGGGFLARKYQDVSRKLGNKSQVHLDCLGIHATRLNAQLVKNLFEADTEDVIVKDPTIKPVFQKPILICSGWRPGWSTDYDATLLAKTLGIKTIINMTNVDYIYDKDPKKYKNAKPLAKVSWKDYRKIVGNAWKPGMNTPFDPIASIEGERQGLRVYMVGKNLINLKNLLEGKKFKGSVIY